MLVTGAAGFIGSHLVERLVHGGSRVVALDRLLWGEQRIEHIVDGEHVLLERGDIRDESFMARVASLGPFDTVFHLAALHYIPYCTAHPVEALGVNVLGTQVLLEAVKEKAPRRFLFASTGDIYAPNDSPHEETDRIEPFSFYGMTKAFGERQLAVTSAQMPDTAFSVVRLFNAYGPRETNPHLIPDIIDQLKRGHRLLVGNTWPTRDYVYVTDIVEALQTLAARRKTDKFEVFNVGTGRGHTVAEVIDLLGKILGVHIPAESQPDRIRPVERPSLVANAGKIESMTGWRARFSLEDGLRELCVHEQLVKRA